MMTTTELERPIIKTELPGPKSREIIEAEIRSAQYEVLLEAARLVLTDAEPIAVARQLRERAEQIIRPK